MRKPWDHTINLREDFVPRKKKNILNVERKDKEGERICRGTVEKRVC